MIHKRIPHHVSNGIRLLFSEKQEKVIATDLVIKTINTKNNGVIVDNPETKQSKSSGKKGNKNIKASNILSTFETDLIALLSAFSPTSHFTAL